MDETDHISASGDTEAPCMATLFELGYEVTRRRQRGRIVWVAIRDDRTLEAPYGPCMLLGLHTMAERRGGDWRASGAEIDAYMDTYESDL